MSYYSCTPCPSDFLLVRVFLSWLLGSVDALKSDEPDHQVILVNSTLASSLKQISLFGEKLVLDFDLKFSMA
jgi:hypothetical protein